MCAKSFQLCPTLCDPMDCSPAGSSVHGILQARILEWIAMSHSRVSSQPRDQSCISYMSCVYFNNFFFIFKKPPFPNKVTFTDVQASFRPLWPSWQETQPPRTTGSATSIFRNASKQGIGAILVSPVPLMKHALFSPEVKFFQDPPKGPSFFLKSLGGQKDSC